MKCTISSILLYQHNIDCVLASSAIADGAVLNGNDNIVTPTQDIEPALKPEQWAACI